MRPLDLLLGLIEKRDLDISEIALAQVTEQYLHYLKSVEETQPEELADFLVVAAKLMLIKSKTLLPVLDFEEEENDADLAVQLRLYKEFVRAAEGVERLLRAKKFLYGREKIPENLVPEFHPPLNFGVTALHRMFLSVIASVEPLIKLPEKTLAKAISLQEKVLHLRELLQQKKNVRFSQLLNMAADRTEIVVSFMALLELIKDRTAQVVQRDNFADIEIQGL